MYHSITFGDKNTWTDWHLIPSSRPIFNLPPLKTRFVDIPGANGQLNMSGISTGRPIYGPRTGSLEFVVMNGYLNWEESYSNIMNYLHGRTMTAILEDDPDFYYEGIFTVNQWQSSKVFSLITIDYNLNPYKLSNSGTLDYWLWDPFDFEIGIVTDNVDYENVVINGPDSHTMTIIGSPKASALRVSATTATMTVKFKGTVYPIPKGISFIPGIMLLDGVNTLTFSGYGAVTIDYRGGSF